ncbi:ribonuclease catalytic domain-containing protein [Treponema pectinovorum]|uniref:ribonuclease catalytic domain-containing protein n=1 Tax=Treponema pectinovorum TaxID=164 RepID=UPI0011CB4DC4|nr:RNB domain-containing ribonuclease [Treponema pectinovorum]
MKKNSVVIYKNACSLVGDFEGEKFSVTWCVSRACQTGKRAVFASQKVRSRDVVVLSEDSATSLDSCLDFEEFALKKEGEVFKQLEELHELLLSEEDTSSSPIGFDDFFELLRGTKKPDESWGVYRAAKESFLFEEKLDSTDVNNVKISFVPRSLEKIEEIKNKLFEKEHSQELRELFIKRLKNFSLDLPSDSRFMGEVEAFALGMSDKCKVLKEAGFKETPEKAHEILLKTKIWDITRNPYPLRWGLSAKSADITLKTPPEEERFTVPGFSYAIDSPWSTDPDDAIGFDGEFLWVHIADPASTVFPDSPIEKSARNRGATLYLPEGAARMLCEDSIEDYALGLKEKSLALSFKIKLDENCEIQDCTVLRTIVNVKRLTYQKADELKDSPELKPLFEIAKKNAQRRAKKGAISVNMPEIHVSVESQTKKVSLEEVVHYESGEVVREAMILAGEGASLFAFKNSIPIPFISQDSSDIPSDIPSGLAGQYRLRRCMRKRNVGVTPSSHAALGLSMYTQVTSPLRRYGDLLVHEQLRAFIKGEKLLDKDEVLLRVSAGDAAARAAKQAERNSNLHWTLVYLLQNPTWKGTAVCLSIEPKQTVFFIKELGIETSIAGIKCELNGEISVKVQKIDLPKLEVVFTSCEES